MDWYLKALRHYVNFNGRARRKEYWMFHIVNFILAGVLSIVDKILGLHFHFHLPFHFAKGAGALTALYSILVLLPLWAVQFRRLHDTDRSAWWLLLMCIPVVGWLIVLAFNCQSGTPGANRFGPDPKVTDIID